MMFSSPAIQLQENSHALSSRKASLQSSVTRKAFGDRGVNHNTPHAAPLKSKLNVFNEKTPAIKKTEFEYPDWLMDSYTDKEIKDTYEDILPLNERMSSIMKYVEIPDEPTLLNDSGIEMDAMLLELPPDKFAFELEHIEEDETYLPSLKYVEFNY